MCVRHCFLAPVFVVRLSFFGNWVLVPLFECAPLFTLPPLSNFLCVRKAFLFFHFDGYHGSPLCCCCYSMISLPPSLALYDVKSNCLIWFLWISIWFGFLFCPQPGPKPSSTPLLWQWNNNNDIDLICENSIARPGHVLWCFYRCVCVCVSHLVGRKYALTDSLFDKSILVVMKWSQKYYSPTSTGLRWWSFTWIYFSLIVVVESSSQCPMW